MDRVAIRITRFEDQDAYGHVLDLLAGLYPDRDPAELGSTLARTPCLVSHDASPRAAHALTSALEARGATVRVTRVIAEEPASDEYDSSPDVDVQFLRRSLTSSSTLTGSARAVPTPESQQMSEEWSTDKAPWES